MTMRRGHGDSWSGSFGWGSRWVFGWFRATAWDNDRAMPRVGPGVYRRRRLAPGGPAGGAGDGSSAAGTYHCGPHARAVPGFQPDDDLHGRPQIPDRPRDRACLARPGKPAHARAAADPGAARAAAAAGAARKPGPAVATGRGRLRPV